MNYGADPPWEPGMPEYYTNGLWLEQTNRVVIDGFRGRQPGSGDDHGALLRDTVRRVILRNSQATEGTTTFLRHRNVTEAGLFGNNDLTKAATASAPLPSPFSAPQTSAPSAAQK
jgi:hypothetical protein